MNISAFIIDGLLIGFVYGIAAMGLTLIWGVMNVINLSHGSIIALGMFGIYFLFSGLGLNPYIGLLLVAAVGLVSGMLIYTIAIQRVINAPHLSTLLATFAVNMIIIGLATTAFSTSPRNVDFSLGSISIGSINILGTRAVAAVASVLITGGAVLFPLPHDPRQVCPGGGEQPLCRRTDGHPLDAHAGAQLRSGDDAGGDCRWADRHVFPVHHPVRRHI